MEQQIKRFLEDHPDKAYQANEVAEAMGTQKGQSVWADILALLGVSNILDRLALTGEIQKKMVSGAWFYKCLD